MNCKTCRSLFSDLLERSLREDVRREVRHHLTACSACQKELRGLRATVKLVRSTPPEPPPDGLSESIVTKLSTAQPVPEPAADKARWRAAGGIWLAGAAGVVLAGLLGYLAGQDSSWAEDVSRLEADLGKSRGQVGELVRTVSELREVLEIQKVELDDRLREAKATLEISLRQGEEAMRAETERRAAAEDTQRELARTVAAQKEEISRLAGELQQARGEISKLGEALAHSISPPGGALGDLKFAGYRPEASVVFRRRGSGYEVDVAGPLDRVVPQLLSAARNDADPEIASLALGALENLLGPDLERYGVVSPEPAPAEPREGGGILERVHNGIEGLARQVGIVSSENGVSQPASPRRSDRERRLRDLEKGWSQIAARGN